ncbi:MAG: cytochrome c3 family protein [Thermodesulfobacteriota bacterium]
MKANKELQAAYGITIILLVIGILSFTAFSAKPPEQPVRIMLKSTGGKVLFDHKTHTAESGYGIKCLDCHHHPEGDDAAVRSCGDCHTQSEEKKEAKKESSVCRECHDEGELDTEETTKRSDAFHKQCIDCHKENDAGPKECAACHVL